MMRVWTKGEWAIQLVGVILTLALAPLLSNPSEVKVAFWPALWAGVSALGGLYGAYMGNKNAKKGLNQQKELIDAQKKRMGMFDQTGQHLLGQGQGNLDMVQGYLRDLASGNRAQTEQAVAPEINMLSDQVRGSVAAQRNLYPRGGSGAAAAADIPRQYNAQVSNLLFGVRPRAMEQLGTLGSNQASLGLGAMGQGAGLTNSMLDFGLRSREQMFNQGAMTGQGLGNSLLLSYMMSQNGQTPPSAIPGSGSSTGLAPWGAGYVGNGNGQMYPWGAGLVGSGGGSTYSQPNNPYSTTNPNTNSIMYQGPK